MNNIKRGMILILACVMLLGVTVACGNKNDEIVFVPEGGSFAAAETGETGYGGESLIDSPIASAEQGRFTYFAVNGDLSEGLLSVKLLKEGDEYKKDYVIDTEGRIRFQISDVFGEDAYISCYSNGAAVANNIVADRHGNILASPEKDGYEYVIRNKPINGYVLVAKDISDASGDRLALGVMRTDGVWIRKVGTDNALTAYFAEKGISPSEARKKLDTYMTFYGEPDVNEYDPQYRDHVYLQISEDKNDLYVHESKAYYDLVDDVITKSYPHICLVEGEEEFTRRVSAYSKYDPPREFGTGIVDSDGNTVKELLNSYEPFRCFENAIVCKKLFEIDTTSEYIVISKDGEILYDFEGYNVQDIKTVTESHCVCYIQDENGSDCLAVFDRNGALCFEPIAFQRYQDELLCTTDSCILLKFAANPDKITRVDFDGTKKEFDYQAGYSGASITYVLPAYGMIVVCSYHDYYTHSDDFCLNFDGDLVMDENTIH